MILPPLAQDAPSSTSYLEHPNTLPCHPLQFCRQISGRGCPNLPNKPLGLRLHTLWMWHCHGEPIKTDAQQGRSSQRQAEGDAEKIQYNGGKRP